VSFLGAVERGTLNASIASLKSLVHGTASRSALIGATALSLGYSVLERPARRSATTTGFGVSSNVPASSWARGRKSPSREDIVRG
jgi:hypothetical protein